MPSDELALGIFAPAGHLISIGEYPLDIRRLDVLVVVRVRRPAQRVLQLVVAAARFRVTCDARSSARSTIVLITSESTEESAPRGSNRTSSAVQEPRHPGVSGARSSAASNSASSRGR